MKIIKNHSMSANGGLLMMAMLIRGLRLTITVLYENCEWHFFIRWL